VEIGQYTLAPFAAQQMASLGADVVKVEAPQGDALRQAGAQPGRPSQIFAMMNADKRGVVLDLSTPDGRTALHLLLAEADVLVENLRPGALAAFGFTPEALRKSHPRLIYCSLSGFGADSAYPGRPAYDTVVQAMSGLMASTREEGEPFKTGISTSDLVGSQCGLVGMLAALEARDIFGTAAHLDIAMQDATAWLATVIQMPQPQYRVVTCQDGDVLVEGAQAQSLPGRWTGTRASLQARAGESGLRATPVMSVTEVVAHPQTAARQLLLECSSASGERATVLNSPLRLERSPAIVRQLMPSLGADHAAIVAEFNLPGATPEMAEKHA
jgi:crotonobetainyl-CoA:carnitine CoA-transferase CaiB-like acyl-CoA transferase